MQKLTDKNRLSIAKPLAAAMWNYEKNGTVTPSLVTFGTHKKFWWRCKFGHEWESRVNDVTSGYGCPYCSGRKVNTQNCLASLNRQLANEWNYNKNENSNPCDFTCGSNTKVWWKCKKGHEWKAQINNRNLGQGCPYCVNQKLCSDNCLAKTNPELAIEWNYEKNGTLSPFDVVAGTNTKAWWRCKNGHEWESRISKRNHGDGCPFCSGRRVCKQNCLATIAPHLISEWDYEGNLHPLTPKSITASSHKKVKWKCYRGHKWMSTVYNRVIGGNGCPKCGKVLLKDGTCFASLPEAYYYLKHLRLSHLKGDIVFNKKYPNLGNYRYDFYVKSTNTYIEVTGYGDHSKGWGEKIWTKYKEIIKKKEDHVRNFLNANFVFIQLRLTSKQVNFVRRRSL